MYDALVSFIGTPPSGCEPYLYIASIAFTLYIVSEFYSLLRLLNISSILPCPIIEYPSLPIPVSINSSSTSFSLHGVLFIKYPVSPLLYNFLVTVTS